MKKIISSAWFVAFALVGSTLLPFAAKADIAPSPGYHEWAAVAVIDNLADYPDYDVYVSCGGRFGPKPCLAEGPESLSDTAMDPDGHFGSSSAPFYAVKKSDQAKIVHQDDPGGELGDIWYTIPANREYLLQASVTGEPTDISDEVYGSIGLPDSNPVTLFASVYHIDELKDGSFAVRLVTESRYDKNGHILSSTTNQVTPLEIQTFNTPAIILGVIVALGAILLFLGWRMKK